MSLLRRARSRASTSAGGEGMGETKVKRRFVPSLSAVWRWGKRIGLCLLGLVVSLGIYFVVRHHQVCAALEQAVAELDASDPGWRLEDIEAAREKVPDQENSAPIIVQVAARLPGPDPYDWPPGDLRTLLQGGSRPELLP